MTGNDCTHVKIKIFHSNRMALVKANLDGAQEDIEYMQDEIKR